MPEKKQMGRLDQILMRKTIIMTWRFRGRSLFCNFFPQVALYFCLCPTLYIMNDWLDDIGEERQRTFLYILTQPVAIPHSIEAPCTQDSMIMMMMMIMMIMMMMIMMMIMIKEAK